MVSRKEFFKSAARETFTFLRSNFSAPPSANPPIAPTPPTTDDLAYEAMALGIDPATVDASQLPDLVARARAEVAPVTPRKE